MQQRWFNSFVFLLLLLFVQLRVGEAKVPGPEESLHLGTINPTGIMHKSSYLLSLPQGPTIWGIAESQLSRQGISQFQRELKFNAPQYSYHAGAPAPLRSLAPTAIGGKQVGTGFVTTCPSRPLVRTWDQNTHDQARIQASTFLHQNHWIHGAVVYAKASRATSPEVRKETDEMLALLTTRIVRSMTGKRFIMGDFNQLPDALEQPKIWYALGWREVQSLARCIHGTDIRPTCHRKTHKDFVWISPELVEFFQDVEFNDAVFPDHAYVGATFAPFGPPEKIPIWKQPRPLELGDIELPDQTYRGDPTVSTQQACRDLAHAYETRVQTALRAQNKPAPLPNQLGRATTIEPTHQQAYSKPATVGRSGSFSASYAGISLTYNRWVKQLRRIESMTHSTKRVSQHVLQQDIHLQREWRAVLHASGFPKGFRRWWSQHCGNRAGVIQTLPWDPPSHGTLASMQLVFRAQVEHLETQLIQELTAKAKAARVLDPHKVFRDMHKPRTSPVQLLDHSKSATIAAVEPEESAIVLKHPVDFDPVQPIYTEQGPLEIIHQESDKLWVGDCNGIVAGTEVRQDHLIGKLCDLFREFGATWTARWDKHLEVPESRWDTMNSFIEEHVPQRPVMEYHPVTLEQWYACLRHKPSRSATGPDGMSRQDLLALPRDLQVELIRIVTAVEAGQPWPVQWITGFIHSLEKKPGASTTGQFRPICVFSLAYRVWSSLRAREAILHLAQWAPHTIFGSLPQKSAKDLWYSIQLCIEDHYFTGEALTGCMMDLTKAFNCLPRVPLLLMCSKLGMPAPVMRAWSSALHGMQRRFVIRGGVGPSLRSTTGYAEGCALSVVAMLACNVLAVEWLAQAQPRCQLWSYVDNLELLAPDEEAMLQGYQALDLFCQEMDLQEDKAKTFFWATTPSTRRMMRGHHLPMQSQARDLGAHVQYTRQCTNATIVQKIQNFEERWKSYARSKAPFDQKRRVLYTVIWPNVLHGISSAHLGKTHHDHMRTEAVRGLNEHHPGTSPIALLSLTQCPLADPGFYALWHTILDFRAYVTPEYAQPILDSLVQPSLRIQPPPGPCAVLLARVQEIGWHWDNTFHDHLGWIIDLWEASIQELWIRVKESWQQHVLQSLSNRKTFQGSPQVHAAYTTQVSAATPTHAKILRQALVGTFFTADRLHKRDDSVPDTCTFCGQPDSQAHRHLDCPHFAPERTLTDQQSLLLRQMPEVVRNHGWFPAPATLQTFPAHLLSLPDSTGDFVWPTSLTDRLDLFTDGTCWATRNPWARLGAWGVAVATPSSAHDEFQPIASGILPGFVQTVTRAELTAAIAACKFAIAMHRSFRLWVDNQFVVDQIRAMTASDGWSVKHSTRNSDLLRRLHSVLRQAGGLFHEVVKIVSHQQHANLSPIERWACLGNDCADTTANQAIHMSSTTFRLHQQLLQECSALDPLIQAFHRSVIAIGEKAMKATSSTASDEPRELPLEVPPAPPQIFQPWVFPQHLPLEAVKYHHADWPHIWRWINSVQSGDTIQQWSWFQLYADFAHHTATKGPCYNAKRQSWQFGQLMPQAPFMRRSRWLSEYITGLAKVLGIQLPWGKFQPTSYVLAFWTNGLQVKVDRSRQMELDRWFAETRPIFRKSTDLHVLL
eukprot:Skav228345  [mRNA]  locus=scaffold1898:184153:189039:+ [translate_table: standard]